MMQAVLKPYHRVASVGTDAGSGFQSLAWVEQFGRSILRFLPDYLYFVFLYFSKKVPFDARSCHEVEQTSPGAYHFTSSRRMLAMKRPQSPHARSASRCRRSSQSSINMSRAFVSIKTQIRSNLFQASCVMRISLETFSPVKPLSLSRSIRIHDR
jgi:hypothetical protein